MATDLKLVTKPEELNLLRDPTVKHTLWSVSRQIRLTDFVAALMELAAACLLYLTGAALLDHWAFSHGLATLGRFVVFVGLVSLVVLLTIFRIMPPLVGRFNAAYAAWMIEQALPQLRNALLNIVLLRSTGSAGSDPLEKQVVDLVESTAAQHLKSRAEEITVDQAPIVRSGALLIASVALLALYTVVSPKNPFTSFYRVLCPWVRCDAPTRVTISEVSPGNITVFQGQKVTVQAVVRGLRGDEKPVVEYSTLDGTVVGRTVVMTLPENDYRHRCVLPGDQHGLQQSVTYFIRAGDSRSSVFTINVLPALNISVERLTFKFPSYTGLAQRVQWRSGDIHAIAGTQVEIYAVANRPIKSAWIEPEGNPAKKILMRPIASNAAVATVVLGDSALPNGLACSWYQIRFCDQENHFNTDSVRYRVRVIDDLPPQLQLELAEENAEYSPWNRPVQIAVRAADPDFLLSRVAVFAQAEGQKQEELVLLDATKSEPTNRLEKTVQIVPGLLGAKPGQRITVWAVALDNREPEPNRTTTRRYWFTVGPAAAFDQPDQQPPKPTALTERSFPGENDSQNQPQSRLELPSQGASGAESRSGGQSASGDTSPASASKPASASESQSPESSSPTVPESDQASNPQQASTAGQSQSGDESRSQAPENSRSGQQSSASGAQSQSMAQQGQSAGEGGSSAPSPNISGNQGGGSANEPSNPDSTSERTAGPGTGSGNQPGSSGEPSVNLTSGQPLTQARSKPEKPVAVDPDVDPGEAFQRILDYLASHDPTLSGLNAGKTFDGPNFTQESRNPASTTDENGPANMHTQGNLADFQGANSRGQSRTESSQTEPAQTSGKTSSNNTGLEEATQPATSPNEPLPQAAQPAAAGQQNQVSQPSTTPVAGQPQPDFAPSGDTFGQDRSQAPPKSFAGGLGSKESETGPKDQASGPDSKRPSGDKPETSQLNQVNNTGTGATSAPPQQAQQPGQPSIQHGSASPSLPVPTPDRQQPMPPTPASELDQKRPDKVSKTQSSASDKWSGAGMEGPGQQANAPGEGMPGSNTPGGTGQLEQGNGPELGTGRPNLPQFSPAQTGQRTPAGMSNKMPGTHPGGQSSDSNTSSERPQVGPERNRSRSRLTPGGGNPTLGGGFSTGGSSRSTQQGKYMPDAPNLRYADEATDLVLDYLEKQLQDNQPDSQLLQQLGWTPEQLRRFYEQWRQLKKLAAQNTPEGLQARRELMQALDSLGLKPPNTPGNTRRLQDRRVGALLEQQQFEPPPEWADLYRAYRTGIAAGAK